MDDTIKNRFEKFLKADKLRSSQFKEVVKVDMHCHDKNSDRPSERLGRILGVPETWLETDILIDKLKEKGCEPFTITNHNNARSCWELMDKGYDMVSGAEFTCTLPNSQISIHVLTYGFTPSQEVVLNSIRGNLYKFLSYCTEYNILTVWAHPLYFNVNKFSNKVVMDLEHIATLFTHFEVINGQRDTRQNIITAEWLRNMTPERVDYISSHYSVNIHEICKNPYVNYFVGGSDSHMGIFSGSTGTYVDIEPFKHMYSSKAKQILESIKMGNVATYGSYTEADKMMISFLELFYMIVKKMDDPGLIRVLLHQGTKTEKMTALLISNGIAELRRHKFTLSFLKYFHNALHGKGPDFWKQTFVKKSTREMIREMERVAVYSKTTTTEFVNQTKLSLKNIFIELNSRAFNYSSKNIINKSSSFRVKEFELPAFLRNLVSSEEADDLDVNVGEIFDKLSFPILGSSIITSASFISDRVLHSNRKYLDYFNELSGGEKVKERVLWLTDTFKDKNGVAVSLNGYRDEVIKKGIPVDFLVCDDKLESSDNLIVTKPIGSIELPFYKNQKAHMPNILEIQEIFRRGEYTRIICSTELLMGLVGIYLKECFNVKSHFFMHTDWLNFTEKNMDLTPKFLRQLTRLLRLFYKKFDKLYVLNSDHHKWLSSKEMGIEPSKIKLMKHWVSDKFRPVDSIRPSEGVAKIIYVGRLSREKGLLDIPVILNRLKESRVPYSMTFIGDGPLRETLMNEIPSANFINWVDQDSLPKIYSGADFLIFPSRFDTFGRVVLESMSCGCIPVAYNEKGPKDIIEDGISGIVADEPTELADKMIQHIKSEDRSLFDMKLEALNRSKLFSKDHIFAEFCESISFSLQVEKDSIAV